MPPRNPTTSTPRAKVFRRGAKSIRFWPGVYGLGCCRADGTLAGDRKGNGNYTIVVRGRGAHAGREFEKGINAITALAEIITDLNALNGQKKGLTINLAVIEGGTVQPGEYAKAYEWSVLAGPTTDVDFYPSPYANNPVVSFSEAGTYVLESTGAKITTVAVDEVVFGVRILEP